jgi:phosphoglycerate kinase
MIQFISNRLNFKNKKVLLRVDYNVEIKNNKIVDDFRIRKSLKTINFLKNKAKVVILMSHLGDPKGFDEKFSLKLVASHLSKILNRKIYFITDFENYKKIIDSLPKGSIVLLENLRFHKGEKENSKSFAQKLANLGDIYINDAFSVSHRNNASVCKITEFLPSYGGLLLKEELKNLEKIKNNFKKPFVVILGGAKLKDKLPLIKNFLKTSDYILIGGGMANTFLKSQNIEIGRSLVDSSLLEISKKLLKNKKIILPIDFIISSNYRNIKIFNPFKDKISKSEAILDIGPETVLKFSNLISKAQTIFFNGPLGYFENKNFAKGSLKIAQSILKNKKALKVVGGGETIALFNQTTSNLEKIPNLFVSTGGGAMLEYLANKKLPALEALKISKIKN